MKKIRIDRKKWARGEQQCGETNYLWNEDIKRGCCLGHVIHQVAKCSWGDLQLKSMPTSYYKKASILTDFETDFNEYNHNKIANKIFANTAIRINDGLYTEQEREAKLIELFAENDLVLEFFN